jgi:hypothetical protein
MSGIRVIKKIAKHLNIHNEYIFILVLRRCFDMPNKDGTGPDGQGILAGKGLGPCGGALRRGSGRGMGRAIGSGMRKPYATTCSDEKRLLEVQLQELETEKQAKEKRIKELD